MSTTAPPLDADLAAELRRLKLAAMRQLAPELLVTAKMRAISTFNTSRRAWVETPRRP